MNGSIVLAIPVVGLFARLLASERFVVDGDSMQPHLASRQHLLVDRMTYRRRPPCRGDVVVLRDPAQPGIYCIKRVVGLPQEHVQMDKGRVLINGHPLAEPYAQHQDISPMPFPSQWLLGQDDYFVLGDRRHDSRDSRSFGPVQQSYITGKAWVRYWPPKAWKWL